MLFLLKTRQEGGACCLLPRWLGLPVSRPRARVASPNLKAGGRRQRAEVKVGACVSCVVPCALMCRALGVLATRAVLATPRCRALVCWNTRYVHS